MRDLRLDHLGKTFPPSHAVLDDISLAIPAGQCLAMLGPSGCGKTTLLRIIAGLEAPSTGDVQIGGKLVTHVPSHRRDVAMLFQQPALVPGRTVRQNLRWPADLRAPWAFLRRARFADDAELHRLARLLELERHLDRPVRELSGGQQQRVALGRCLLRQAGICLLDEPLGHLDSPLRVELRRQIRALTRASGMTLLHVTHDPEEAFAIGDQVAVMHAGRIVQIDEPAALRQTPYNRYVAEVVHQPFGGLNVLAGAIDREDMEVFFESAFGRWPVSTRTIAALHEALLPSERSAGAVEVILGVAARAVRCSIDGSAASDEKIRLALPVLEHERTPGGSWVLAGDARGRWIGQSVGAHVSRGQSVAMTFSMQHAFWFDPATGRTLVAPQADSIRANE